MTNLTRLTLPVVAFALISATLFAGSFARAEDAMKPDDAMKPADSMKADKMKKDCMDKANMETDAMKKDEATKACDNM